MSCCEFSKISHFLRRNLQENKESIWSSKFQVIFDPTCSIKLVLKIEAPPKNCRRLIPTLNNGAWNQRKTYGVGKNRRGSAGVDMPMGFIGLFWVSASGVRGLSLAINPGVIQAWRATWKLSLSISDVSTEKLCFGVVGSGVTGAFS